MTSQDDIDRSWHRTCWDITRQLLQSKLLPIDIYTALMLKIEFSGETSIIFTAHGLSELVGLLDACVDSTADDTAEGADLELRLNLSRPYDRTLD